MKKTIFIMFSMVCAVVLAGCTGNPSTPPVPSETATDPSSAPEESKTAAQSEEDTVINVQVGDKDFTATLYGNEAARAIAGEMPFTLHMDDYAAQEKVAGLIFALPSVETQTPAQMNAGDIYLWSGNNLVLFYTTFSNSYGYVPIGRITDIRGLTDALGGGGVDVTFSMKN